MYKAIKLLFIVFATIANNLLAQDVMMPSNNCINCYTLQLATGKPVILFVYIGDNTANLKIENIEGRPVYREWVELQAHYSGIADFKFMSDYGVVQVDGVTKLDLRDRNNYYFKVYYWDGKAASPFIPFEKYYYLTEEIAKLRGEKQESSYKEKYTREVERIEGLTRLNNPSEALRQNLRYYDYSDGKATEYFPYRFLNLQGVKSATIVRAHDSAAIYRISFTRSQCIDTIAELDKAGNVDDADIYTFENGLLKTAGRNLFAYSGDSVISYTVEPHRTDVWLSVMKGNYFVRQKYYWIDNSNKTITGHTTNVAEDGDKGLYIENDAYKGYKTYISDKFWQLPYSEESFSVEKGCSNPGEVIKYFHSNDRVLSAQAYHKGKLTEEITFRLDDKGLVVEAEIYNVRKNRRFTLFYRYSFYQ